MDGGWVDGWMNELKEEGGWSSSGSEIVRGTGTEADSGHQAYYWKKLKAPEARVGGRRLELTKGGLLRSEMRTKWE